MLRSAFVLAVGATFALALPARADVIFTSLTDEMSIDETTGFDGLIGTGDDVSAGGGNPNGDLAYTAVFDKEGWETLLLLALGYLDDSTPVPEPVAGDIGGSTVVYSGIDALEIPATLTEFSVMTTGSLSESFDDASALPHVVDVAADQTFTFDYTLASCAPGTDEATCTSNPAVALDFGELGGRGWILLRGQDPADLPGLDSDAFFGDLVGYMELLTSVAPADWTAISLTVFSGEVTDTSVTGSLVQPSWIGGQAFGVAPFATTQPVPEPGALAGSGAAVAALALVAGRRRRASASIASARAGRRSVPDAG